jgi:hypothetical protein
MKKITIVLVLLVLLLMTACSSSPTGNIVGTSTDELTLQVDIPCSGHASLITQELYTLNGVTNVEYRTGHYFDTTYDSSLTNQEEILALDVFDTYPAKIV